MLFLGFLIGLACMAVWHFGRHCIFHVEEGHVGVLTAFGAARRSADGRLRAFPAGLHMKWPWEQRLHVSLREQGFDLSGRDGGQVVMADDGTSLRLDSMVRYVVMAERLEPFLFGMKAPVEHLTGLFTCLLRNELANVAPVASSDADLSAYSLIRRERKLLNDRLATECRETIEPPYGVRFTAAHLVDIHPPDALAEALNAVITVSMEAKASLSRAQSECAQRVLAAREGVEVAKLNAEAVEREISELARHLGQLEEQGVLSQYVERRRGEVVANSQTVYLDAGERR